MIMFGCSCGLSPGSPYALLAPATGTVLAPPQPAFSYCLQRKEELMLGALLLIVLLILLFGSLGYAVSPLFFILLVALLLIGGVGGYHRHRL